MLSAAERVGHTKGINENTCTDKTDVYMTAII